MAVLAVTIASCGPGNGPPLYTVRGKVVYKGQPAVGATVLFQREDAPISTPESGPLVPTGTADEEGNFTLETGELGYGAPAGKYKVLIQWRTKGEVTADPSASAQKAAGSQKKGRFKIVADKPDGIPDRLEGRFMKADSSKFHVEIKPEQNDLEPFDVSS
jgi:hypothetical protein